MRIHFIGDVHGHLGDLGRILRIVPADLFIQVGDMGIAKRWVGTDEIPPGNLMYIRGNHDQYQYILESKDPRFVDDGNSFDLGNSHFVFCGGGFSVDHRTRIEGLTWWRDEIPEKQVVDKFFDNIRTVMDLGENLVIVTHTPPVRLIRELRPGSEKVLDSLAVDFDNALSHLIEGYPCLWVCGHLHPETIIQKIYRNTKVICIPPIHDSGHNMKPWFPSAGITMEF